MTAFFRDVLGLEAAGDDEAVTFTLRAADTSTRFRRGSAPSFATSG